MGAIASKMFRSKLENKKEVPSSKKPNLYRIKKYYKVTFKNSIIYILFISIGLTIQDRKKNYVKNPMREYLQQNEEKYFREGSLTFA